ncbi:MAG TPA: BREX-1 system phosphatase PglZ type A, partial [Firmicutes bacterium]|nr:BREX-1 system phosphatase PglZ type A [Bacillota bacterium]
MSTESIQFALRERFAAPLPDFYRRRIIFWQDPDREFEGMVDQLSIPGVTILKLTGSNTFAVKKLLLHDDLAGDYLIYNPISYADPRENWLRDVELFSEEFRADYFSMLMDELNIRSNPVMRKTVRMYAAFFSNKERTAKLRRIGREYETPLQLHTDIMAVLAGLNGGSAQDVMIAVLSGGLDEEQNVALNAIKKFGNLDAFWQLVRKYTGYLHEDGQRLTLFAAHVLLTALAQAMNPSALKGLERFISESGEAYCYSLVHEWRSREDASALWELCRTVEQELQLPARFAKLETEALLAGDIFPAIHEAVLSRFLEEISERIVKPELFLQTVENRRTSGWYEQFRYYYDCLYAIARMQEFYQENAAGFHMTEPEKIWKFYADTAYKMDGWYREFYYAFGLALRDGNPVLEDRLKHTADYVETLYQNWYLKELNGCWANAIADGLSSLGYVPGIDRQRDFFAHYGKPAAAKNSRVFVIISDGLRYEVASELCGLLIRTTKGTAKLESMQSVFPSITKFGMAALLPGNRLSVNVNMEVFVDEMPTCSTAEREKVLCAGNPRSVAVQYEDVL